MLCSHEDVHSFSSPYCSGNCAHLLSTCLAGENGALNSEGRAYKRAPKLVASPQLTAPHSTGNIFAEDSVYKNKVGHNSTRGIKEVIKEQPTPRNLSATARRVL